MHLEHAENLGAGTRLGHRLVGNNVEANSLGEGSEGGKGGMSQSSSTKSTKQKTGYLKELESGETQSRNWCAPALADCDNVAFLDTDEGGRQVSGEILVALLETVVLSNVVKVVSADNNGALHLVGNDDTTEDTTADGNITSERALLIDVVTLDGGLRGLVAEANVAVVADTASLGGLERK